ncbi:MAG TPA: methyltransferase [Longimicrobiaceae bacterium]|nr:methyltransferase [Longimicrobiaceae bacterium]
MLAGVGIFAERPDGTFELTPTAALLRSDVPDSMRDITRMMGGEWHWRMYGELMHSVRTGGTAVRKAYGMEIFELLERDPAAGELFNRAMTSNSWAAVPAVVGGYDFSRFRRVVDVAGGQGILLAGILKANPGAQGVLFDLPPVVGGAGELLGREGVADRVELVSGDFFESVPPGADAYVLKHVVHDWDDERSIRILRNVASAMDENGRVLIVEMVVPVGNEPSPSKLLDVQMLMGTGGRERTEEEYRALLEASGLRLTRTVPTRSPLSVIEAQAM